MAGPGPPEFTETFFVPKDNYGAFIRQVRQDVIKYCDDRRPGVMVPHDPLILLPEEKIPKHWFHVVLRTTTSSLTLAIRIDNLYLVGFNTNTNTNPWWEFDNPDGTHFISGSRWLGFNGSYANLVGHDKGLDTVTLGRAEMASAVDFLAENYGGPPAAAADERRQADDSYALPKSKLAKLVIMVCEGMRFHTVCNTVDREFDHAAARISKVEGERVRDWDKISVKVRMWAVDPEAKFDDMEKIGINNMSDAARIVALVKGETSRG